MRVHVLFSIGCSVLWSAGVVHALEEGQDTTRTYRLPGVSVVEERERHGGGFTWISPQRYEELHAVSIEEVLRTVPGVFLRPEDGMGLRVNIGIRGLPPTRSEKVLVLEDGIPIAPAPYGYPELYYHPPLERFRSVEVVKGGAQILYGPQTIGGVVNYLTPEPLRERQWQLHGTGGTRRYGKLYGLYAVRGPAGSVVLDGLYKQGKLSRENTGTRLWDGALKAWLQVGSTQRLLLKLNAYSEVSQATYAGLTQAQFEEDPFQNPFRHDTFAVERYATQLRWEWELPAGSVSVTAYGAHLQRDWWRQGSLVRVQTPGGRDTLVAADNSADPGNYPGVRVLPAPNRADGRLRRYWFAGLEGRWRQQLQVGSLFQELVAGARLHGERQHRYQIRAQSALGRTGSIVEDNWRWVTALSAFVQQQLFWQIWTVTAGVRGEYMRYRCLNALGQGGTGVAGETSFWALIPALGVSAQVMPGWILFAGVHSGFAPPRVEDVIDDTGAITELAPERSWNWELGLRAVARDGLAVELTVFRLDFRNQIIPATLAGGVTSVLTNAGRTLHQGVELALDADGTHLLGIPIRVLGAATWLPVARYEGERFSVLNPAVRITGNRLPYAPEYQLSGTLQWRLWRSGEVQLVVTTVGAQFADDLNTVEPTPNGRQGRLPSYTVVDGTLEWQLAPWGVKIALVGKNLFNRLYIADRTRGILPGMPRMVALGVEWEQ